MINEIVVLGQIPGTNLQITFYEYLVLLPVAGLLVYAYRRHITLAGIERYWFYIKIYLTTRPGSQLSLHL